MNYANQRHIKVDATEANNMFNSSNKNEEEFLHSIKWDSLYPILLELDGNEFKVWLYCFKFWNTKEKGFYFSPAALTQYFGLSESTSQRCFKRLEALGYLTPAPGSIRNYTFHPEGKHPLPSV